MPFLFIKMRFSFFYLTEFFFILCIFAVPPFCGFCKWFVLMNRLLINFLSLFCYFSTEFFFQMFFHYIPEFLLHLSDKCIEPLQNCPRPLNNDKFKKHFNFLWRSYNLKGAITILQYPRYRIDKIVNLYLSNPFAFLRKLFSFTHFIVDPTPTIFFFLNQWPASYTSALVFFFFCSQYLFKRFWPFSCFHVFCVLVI